MTMDLGKLLAEQDAKDRAKDKRLRKAYGWTLAQYNALGAKQDWKCAICGVGIKNAPLQVDHIHFRIKTELLDPCFTHSGRKWYARTTSIPGVYIDAYAKTKAEAIRICREKALPLSVRGLLCPGRHTGCNRLLGRIDKPDWLRKVLAYLENPPAKSLQF